MAWSWRATFMWQPLWHCDVPYSVSFLVTFLRSIEKKPTQKVKNRTNWRVHH